MKRKPTAPLEREIQKAISEALELMPGMKLWRQNTGAMGGSHKGKRWYVKFGTPGQADISGILKANGRRIELEVKRPGEVQTKDQKLFEQMILEHNGIYHVVHCVDEAMAFMRRYIDDPDRRCEGASA